MPHKESASEETEFRLAEISAFEKRYGLEGFGALLDALLSTIKRMIRLDEIPETEEGVKKAMSVIVHEYPEVDRYLKKFTAAVAQETVNEIKQAARPN